MADDDAAPIRLMSRSGTRVVDEEPADEEDGAGSEPDALNDETRGDGYTDGANGQPDASSARRWIARAGPATLVGLVVVLALAGLVGWLGFRTHEARQANAQRELFLQAGRQGAINLTTIDFTHADTDIQRILDSATGTFYDDFSKRSQPFVDVVKQTQSKTVGTVTGAGLESESPDQAQVLVALSVKTSNTGSPDQPPRAWRMRISVQNVGGQDKVSNVEFVP